MVSEGAAIFSVISCALFGGAIGSAVTWKTAYAKGRLAGNDYGYKLGKEDATKATRAEIVAMGQKVAALFEKAAKP